MKCYECRQEVRVEEDQNTGDTRYICSRCSLSWNKHDRVVCSCGGKMMMDYPSDRVWYYCPDCESRISMTCKYCDSENLGSIFYILSGTRNIYCKECEKSWDIYP